MKKFLTVLLVSVVAAGSSYAQTFQLGLKAGANVSNFTGDFRQIDKKALIGFHVGGMFNMQFGSNFSVQPEVIFSNQGAKLELINGDKEDYKVSYINVPVMLKFKTNGGFYIELGPQAGFKVSENTENTSIQNFAKDLDLSGAVGIGYHGNSGFGIGARYLAGFSKVRDFDTQNLDVDPDFKNSVLQVSLFFTLFNNNR